MEDPELDSICKRLDTLGWRKSTVSRMDKFEHVWYRYFIWEPKCQDNKEKDLQVQLQLWDNRKYPGGAMGFVVEICGRPSGPDIGSVTFRFGCRGDVENIEPNVERLLKAWRAIQEKVT
jgi:hypothetical protein